RASRSRRRPRTDGPKRSLTDQRQGRRRARTDVGSPVRRLRRRARRGRLDRCTLGQVEASWFASPQRQQGNPLLALRAGKPSPPIFPIISSPWQTRRFGLILRVRRFCRKFQEAGLWRSIPLGTGERGQRRLTVFGTTSANAGIGVAAC